MGHQRKGVCKQAATIQELTSMLKYHPSGHSVNKLLIVHSRPPFINQTASRLVILADAKI
jgi:hypothetical protein